MKKRQKEKQKQRKLVGDRDCRKVIQADADKADLVYLCPECDTVYKQPLEEVVFAGTAICPDCECRCEITGVEVEDE